MSKINKNRILEKVKFKRLVRPTNYTIITLFISIYFLVLGVDIFLISLGFTILISVCSYLGYYYPRNSCRRAIFLLISSIGILIDVCFVSSTAILEIEIENIGIVIINLRALFVAPIILLCFNTFKKVIDLFDSWNNNNREPVMIRQAGEYQM